MRIRIFILILTMGFLSNLKAQQWVENGSLDTIRIQLKLKNNRNPQQYEINNALRAIAYAGQKPVEILQINWEFISSYEVFRQEKGNFKSDIVIKPMAPVGDLNLYEFNSAEYILPVLQSFRLRIFKEDSSLVYLKYFNQNPLSVHLAGQENHFSIWHERWAKGYYMKIDQFEFKYNASNYTFEKWFQFVNDYKAANYIVDDLLMNYKQKQQSVQEPCSFLVKSFVVADQLKKIYQMPFYEATVGTKNDPNQLEQKMKLFSVLINLNIDKYVAIYKNSVSTESVNLGHLIDAYLLEEENRLRLQQNYVSMYKELFTALSITSYPLNLTYQNLNIFDLMSEGKDGERKQLVSSFEVSLYKKSMANIDTLIAKELFSEALFYVDNVEGFVKNSEALKLSDSFKQTKAIAAYGMYHSYMKVVDRALDAKNFKLAAQYLRKAGLVQENYPQEIITNSLVEKKKVQLLNNCFSEYQQMIQKNKFPEAIVLRDTIRDLMLEFKLEGMEAMLAQLNLLDNQAMKN